MCFNANLLAHFEHRAHCAARPLSCADVFAKGNEQAVDLHPILLREFGFKSNHGLLWCGSLHIPPTIGLAMHMNINTNACLVFALLLGLTSDTKVI